MKWNIQSTLTVRVYMYMESTKRIHVQWRVAGKYMQNTGILQSTCLYNYSNQLNKYLLVKFCMVQCNCIVPAIHYECSNLWMP